MNPGRQIANYSGARVIALSLGVVATASPATAQNFPQKPLRMIVAAAPGGANDLLGRMYAQRLSESLGQSVIVDNHGGGGGAVGT
jgi:tripartite-type tricarboxylate transporter receptor subunit TctC